MSLRLNKKQIWALLAAFLLLALSFTALYFWLLSPLKTEAEQKETELKTEQKLLQVLDSKIGQKSDDTMVTTVELQKQLPVKPIVEQLLLDIQKAETVSGSQVMSMSFAESEASGDSLAAETSSGNTQTDSENGSTPASSATADSTNSEAAVTEDEQDANEENKLPAGVSKVTVNMTVQSPTYFELESFIQSLEEQSRIMKVDSLQFSGSPEVTSVEQSSEKMSYQLAVTAFYAPGLTDLVKQMPKIDTPEPSHKRYPFGDVPDSAENASESDR
ncbi:GspMb/PilO family protein [Peribacillus sp. SCS-155]|uniref:GspMb/PilO family protein n=1 Tax=Peribacillus sedimenti TaxID=3115297 RepID=UPI003905DAEB